MALAWRNCLIDASERGEGVGSDAGGVFGPAMILTKDFFVSSESGVAKCKPFNMVAGGHLKTRQFVTNAICGRMLRTERRFADGQRALTKRARCPRSPSSLSTLARLLRLSTANVSVAELQAQRAMGRTPRVRACAKRPIELGFLYLIPTFGV